MTDTLATIVIVPRERFSAARRSLESIYEHTEPPFEFVYVVGAPPSMSSGATPRSASTVRPIFITDVSPTCPTGAIPGPRAKNKARGV